MYYVGMSGSDAEKTPQDGAPKKQRLKLMVEDCNCDVIQHELEERSAELEHEKMETEVVLHSLGEAMYVVDKDYVVRMMNPYAAELLGYANPDEVIGRPLDEVVPAFDEKGNRVPLSHRSNVRALMGKKNREEWSASAYFERKDGTKFPVQVTTTAISIDDQRTGAITVFRDVSRDKKLDDAKTEFIYLAAHQLRTPVSVIMLNLELISKYYQHLFDENNTSKDAEETRQGLAAINSAANALTELIDTLLDISRIEMGTLEVTKEDINFRQMIDTEVTRQRALAEQKNESFNIELDNSLPESVSCNRRLLQIILQNLISNAVKYNKNGGVVTVAAQKVKGNIRISVSDQGIGIPHGDQREIFNKFFRAENTLQTKEKGTGLGLYLVRTAIKELGGVVWFESEPGKGTTFFFEFLCDL
jgi:PAS domain S-box-containing protein